jgi:hypothetical protein
VVITEPPSRCVLPAPPVVRLVNGVAKPTVPSKLAWPATFTVSAFPGAAALLTVPANVMLPPVEVKTSLAPIGTGSL